MSRARALAVVLASFAIAAGVANVACDGTQSLSDHEYFPRVATLAADLDTSLGARNAATPGTNATVVRVEERLRTFAAGLDGIRPPSDAKDAHHDLTVASKNLADAARRAVETIATPQHAPATGEATGNAVFVRDWVSACHRLQDRALADKIDVDLRCTSTLREDATGG